MIQQDVQDIYGSYNNTSDIYGNSSNGNSNSNNNSTDEDLTRDKISKNGNLTSEEDSSEYLNDEESYEISNESSSESGSYKNSNEDYDIIESIINYEVQNGIINVRSTQEIKEAINLTQSTFPNPAYEAFVQLVTKHKLSDSVTNDIIHFFNNFHMSPTAALLSNAKSARALLDSIEIPHVLYSKTIVMEYNQVQYTLYHRTILDTIKELLSNKEIFKHCIF